MKKKKRKKRGNQNSMNNTIKWIILITSILNLIKSALDIIKDLV